MNIRDLEDYREGNRLEAKGAQGGLPGDVWSTVSAFANTDGGTIVLGIKENTKTHELGILGVSDAHKMLEDFVNAANSKDKLSHPIFSDEHLRVEEVDGVELVVIEVPRVDRFHRPVFVGHDPFTGTYRRKFVGDYRCTREEVAGMMRDASQLSSDSEIAESSGLVCDFSIETVRRYRAIYNHCHGSDAWSSLEDEAFLCRIGAAAIDKGGLVKPTKAGLLMFGQEWLIAREFPNYFLDYRQNTNSNSRWDDRFTSQDPEWSGNVFDFFDRAYSKLRQALKVPFKLDGLYRVEDTPAHEALREALVNVVTNADYQASRGVVCQWDDLGIRLTNPGGFRVEVEKAYVGGISDARNKTMLKMFSLIDLGERAGSGVPNLVEQWVSCGYERPVLSEEVDPESSSVFLPLTVAGCGIGARGGAAAGQVVPLSNLSRNEKIAVEIAGRDGAVTTKKLATEANVSARTASTVLKGLSEREVLCWRGSSKSDPAQYYELT